MALASSTVAAAQNAGNRPRTAFISAASSLRGQGSMRGSKAHGLGCRPCRTRPVLVIRSLHLCLGFCDRKPRLALQAVFNFLAFAIVARDEQ